ncbi:MAG: hypothetical protein DRQ78_07815 [Epsilonproteobacteria bacterium]|nr:MAG: hypothetical protein DRQ78_07815 [Campylobacterota bacterium]
MKTPYISHAGYAAAIALVLFSVSLVYLSIHKIIPPLQTAHIMGMVGLVFVLMLSWEYVSKSAYNKKYKLTNLYTALSDSNIMIVKSTFFRFLALFIPFYIAYFIVHNHFYFIKSDIFAPTIEFFDYLLIIFLVLGPPYLFLTLKYRGAKHYEFNDYAILSIIGFKSFVCLFLCKNKTYNFYKNRRIKKVFLVYLVNFFFITLMARFLLVEFHGFEANMNILFSEDYNTQHWYNKARNWYFICFHLLFVVDVGIATIGYAFASRWLGNRTKSVDFTAMGWFVALFCYPPFNELISGNFIYYHSLPTHEIITSQLVWSVIFVLLLIVYTIYVWATIALGFKFSNLTNRGIISHGPYKYVRHPAYAAKNIAWFIDSTYVLSNIWASLAFFTWNSIYILRALTEEKHLKKDKDYQSYREKVRYYFIPKII